MKLLYVDTSALFKCYVEEDESEAVLTRMEDAPRVGTSLITRVEVAAALAQAVRRQRMDQDEARAAEREFLNEWDDFTRIGFTDAFAAQAGDLAWRHDLRGYERHMSDLRVQRVRKGFRRKTVLGKKHRFSVKVVGQPSEWAEKYAVLREWSVDRDLPSPDCGGSRLRSGRVRISAPLRSGRTPPRAGRE